MEDDATQGGPIADLGRLPIAEFVAGLERRFQLGLGPAGVDRYVSVLVDEQLFKFAGEMEAAVHDRLSLRIMGLPSQLITSILKAFAEWRRVRDQQDKTNRIEANAISVDSKDLARVARDSVSAVGRRNASSVVGSAGPVVAGLVVAGPVVAEPVVAGPVAEAGAGAAIIERKSKNDPPESFSCAVCDEAVQIQTDGCGMQSLDESDRKEQAVASVVGPVCPPARPALLLNTCRHRICVECLRSHVKRAIQTKSVARMRCPARGGCAAEITQANVRSSLSSQEFDKYLEASVAAFIENDESSVKCPGCGVAFTLAAFAPKRVPDQITEQGPNGKTLSPQLWLHFMRNRIRCRSCGVVFCASCRDTPYHKGFTCAEHTAAKAMPTCRFCESRLSPELQAQNPPSAALTAVCREAECLARRDACCTEVLPCGCPCGGLRGETKHLPCLKHDLQCAEDLCNICHVETLGSAPAVRLRCGHTFHWHCTRRKLSAKWPGARVSFEYMHCPLCKTVMEHPALTAEMAPHVALRNDIQSRSLERLAFEGLSEHKRITDPKSPFYGNPAAFALFYFVFYQCFKCSKCFFAGAYACQDSSAEFDPADLVCPSCQITDIQDCTTHGKQWLAFKCRFCCSVASWYCWGNTHFCTRCHRGGAWQKLVVFRSGKNKCEIWDYPQCKGIQRAIEALPPGLSLEQKRKACKEIKAVASLCPLKTQHPPNGIEFGLGCIMCGTGGGSNGRLGSAEAADQRQAKPARRSTVRDVEGYLSSELPEEGLLCEYGFDFDGRGIIHRLATCGGQFRWVNPCRLALIKVTTSGLMHDSAPPSAAVGRKTVRCVTRPVCLSWFCVEFVASVEVEPTHYTARHYSSWDTECLRNWVFESSLDGQHWDTLRVHRNDKKMELRAGATATWTVEAHGHRYRLFRLKITGRNSNRNYYLALSGFEVYGRVFPLARESKVQGKKSGSGQGTGSDVRGLSSGPAVAQNPKMPVADAMVRQEPKEEAKGFASLKDQKIDRVGNGCGDSQEIDAKDEPLVGLGAVGTERVRTGRVRTERVRTGRLKSFTYKQDLDKNGILFHLGTQFGTRSFQNPVTVGHVDVSCSGLSLGGPRPSAPAHAILDRKLLRCVTVSKPGMWFCFKLKKGLAASVSHYTLRHYSSWDTESLRNWAFEGSRDGGTTWTLLRLHVNDQALSQAGQAYTWDVPKQQGLVSDASHGFYNWFRVRQTGPNSNNHDFLALSWFEIYGMLSVPPQVIESPLHKTGAMPHTTHAPKLRVERRPVSAFDENGILFHLATCGGREPYQNPSDRGYVVVTSSPLGSLSCPNSALVGRDTVRWVTAPRDNNWFCLEFKGVRIRPTHYALRHYSSWDNEALRSWRFEASCDNGEWTVLRDHRADESLDGKGSVALWPISPRADGAALKYLPFFSRFRVIQTGRNSNLHYFLACSGIEVYGTMEFGSDGVAVRGVGDGRGGGRGGDSGARVGNGADAASLASDAKSVSGSLMKDPSAPVVSVAPIAAVPPAGKEFKYSGIDFDQNGLVYYLGSFGGRELVWENPGRCGLVKVTSSPLAEDPPSLPAWGILSRSAVRCVTQARKRSHFTISFGDQYAIRPSAYSLRHYSTYDTEAARNWRLEGYRTDGKAWDVLREHRGDRALAGRGATHTWTLRCSRSYSRFRVWQTGPNSNGHWFLALSGFEVYGIIVESQAKTAKKEAKPILA